MSSKQLNEIAILKQLYSNEPASQGFFASLEDSCFSESQFEELLEAAPEADEWLIRGLKELGDDPGVLLEKVAGMFHLPVSSTEQGMQLGGEQGFTIRRVGEEWLLQDRDFACEA